MKDLFLALLKVANEHGNITEANMYNQDFSTIEFVKDEKKYSFNIRACEVKNED